MKLSTSHNAYTWFFDHRKDQLHLNFYRYFTEYTSRFPLYDWSRQAIPESDLMLQFREGFMPRSTHHW